MNKKTVLNPLGAAVGTAFAVSLSASSATAAENPFGFSEFRLGSLVSEMDPSGRCGEGKCGGEKSKAEYRAEGKCGEGKCGKDMISAGRKPDRDQDEHGKGKKQGHEDAGHGGY